MSNDTENNQLNGCFVWAAVIAIVIAAAVGAAIYFWLRWIGGML